MSQILNQTPQTGTADPEQVYFEHLISLGVFGRGSKENEDFEKIKVKRREAVK